MVTVRESESESESAGGREPDRDPERGDEAVWSLMSDMSHLQPCLLHQTYGGEASLHTLLHTQAPLLLTGGSTLIESSFKINSTDRVL